jgi:hypothetical protein
VGWNLSDIVYYGEDDKTMCSSYSVSIAPIPSSVLSIESQYNQTFTTLPGVVTRATTQYGGGPAVTTFPPTSSLLPSNTAASVGGSVCRADGVGVLLISAILSGILCSI